MHRDLMSLDASGILRIGGTGVQSQNYTRVFTHGGHTPSAHLSIHPSIMTDDLFADDPTQARIFHLSSHAVLLKGFALAEAPALLQDIHDIASQAPWRHMLTPGGKSMSVANTNCGDLGWTSDAGGYRYRPTDPITANPWPRIPERWLTLAADAKQAAGFEAGPDPDACLLNRYAPGARLTLHQDRDERDFGVPIVSLSLGLPALFLWGGDARSDPYRSVPLEHGDVLVWGGPDRLRFHGVKPVADGLHSTIGSYRFNVTMRKAG